MKLSFTVLGPPVGKERPRVTARGTYTPKRTRLYEKAVCDVAIATVGTWKSGPDWERWPTGGDYAVECVFYLGSFHAIDTDNLAKAAVDGMQHAVFDNDSQVSKLTALRVYGDANPRTEVTVEYLGAKPVRAKPSKKRAAV